MDRIVIAGLAVPTDINANFEYLFSQVAAEFGYINYVDAVATYADLAPLEAAALDGDAHYVRADYKIYRWNDTESDWYEILNHTFLSNLLEFDNKGIYSAATTYNKYNLVLYGTPSQTFMCKVNGTLATAPPTDPTLETTEWILFASAGVIGYTGSTGYTGSLGATGGIGYTGSAGVGFGNVNTGTTPITVGNIVEYGVDEDTIEDSGKTLSDLVHVVTPSFPIVDKGAPGATVNVDWSAGVYQVISVTQNITITFTNPPFSSLTSGCGLTLLLNFSGNYTVTFAAASTYYVRPVANMPDADRASGNTEIHSFVYYNKKYYQARLSGFTT